MSTLVLESSTDARSFKQFLDRRIEPSWLTKLRNAAWEQFQSMDWPDRREEDWMRSDLRGFHLDKYRPLETREASQESCPVFLLEDVEVEGNIRTLDGVVVGEQVSAETKARGVYFGSLEEACRTHGSLVEAHLFKTIDYTADKFSALQAAAWASGTFLHIPRNVAVERPFHIHAGMTDGGLDIGHVLIVLEENSSATVLYECSSVTPTADGFHCGGLEIVVNQGPTCDLSNCRNGARRSGILLSRKPSLIAMLPSNGHSPPWARVCSGLSTSFARRRGSQQPSQRHDVHSRQAANDLQHTAISRSTSLHQ